MPTPLDYLTENSFSSYPFKDNCSLIPTGQHVPIGDDWFLDFQIVTSYHNVQRAVLSYVATAVDGYGPRIDIAVTTYEPSGSGWAQRLYVVPQLLTGLSERTTITYAGAGVSIKIVPGPGLVKFGTTNPAGIKWIFTNDPTTGFFTSEFVPSTVLITPPVVTSTTYKNERDAAPVMTVNASLHNQTMEAGANIDFLEGVVFDVARGNGTGLYDPCADLPTGVVNSINGIRPNDNGNFQFTADDCYRIIPHIGYAIDGYSFDGKPPGLEFDHACRPKCTQEEVAGFAFYENRVQDAANRISTYIGQVVADLSSKVATANAIKTSNPPGVFIDVANTGTPSDSRLYEAIAVGLYDPSKERLTCDLTAKFSGGVCTASYFAAHPTWAHFVLKDDSTKLEEDGSTYMLTPTIDVGRTTLTYFTGRGIDCRGSVITNTITHIPTTATDKWVQHTLITTKNSVRWGTAFKHHVINPVEGPFFNLRSRRGVRDSTTVANRRFLYTVTIDLFDTDPAWSGNTTVHIVLNSPLYHKFRGLGAIRVNNGAPIYATPAAGGLSMNFTNVAVLYPKRATVTFDLETTGNYPTNEVSLIVTHKVGTATKTVPFQFA